MISKNWKIKWGIVLMIVSVPAFLFIPVIPFLDIDGKVKISLSTASLISGEVLFWSGGLLVGKELFGRYKSYFNPRNWFKKKTEG
jgi:hypothetical protein